MTRYYKLKRYPKCYYKVVGTNAWIIHHPLYPQWWIAGDSISADFLIKNYELIELTKEEMFLELL